MSLVTRVHELTGRMPHRHRVVLGWQLQRSAISIPSNIAEGAGRHHRREFRQYIGVARRSLCELETQLLLGIEIRAFDASDAAEALALVDEVGRMLNRLAIRLRDIARH
jgi:carbamoyl-phosphate synthase large subunit